MPCTFVQIVQLGQQLLVLLPNKAPFCDPAISRSATHWVACYPLPGEQNDALRSSKLGVYRTCSRGQVLFRPRLHLSIMSHSNLIRLNHPLRISFLPTLLPESICPRSLTPRQPCSTIQHATRGFRVVRDNSPLLPSR